jgi:hypothetical protein
MSKERKEVIAFNPPVEWVKEKIESAENTIGSVHFIKRSDGSLRKMSYRLHVRNPSTASAPKGMKRVCKICNKSEKECGVGPYKIIGSSIDKKVIDEKNNQMTVLDANKVIRDQSEKVTGRGAWRTVPLDKVVRISMLLSAMIHK